MKSFIVSTAILIDGSFFLKRYQKCWAGAKSHSSKEIADNLYKYALKHLKKDEDYLYRILYYDCYPLEKKAHNPISKNPIDFSVSSQATSRKEIFNELMKKRKVALRLGYLKSANEWIIRPNKTKDLLAGEINISDLTENDVFYNIEQKGIDIRIGVDIAQLALKRLVQKIILISGDSDFVPAAKLARREGVDVVLDPMWNKVNPDLFEHIDGLQTMIKNPNSLK